MAVLLSRAAIGSLMFASCFFSGAAALRAQTVLLGDSAIEANIDSTALGTAEAFQTTAAASGTVGSINLFLDETSTAGKIYVGIYADSSGQPGSLLTQGSSTTLYPGTWNTITLSAVTVTSGKAYWVAILGTTSGKPVFRDRTISQCGSHTSSQTNLTSLPSTFSSGHDWNTSYLSAYAVSATYPATVLLGNEAVETYLDKNPAGRAEAFPSTANTTGTVGTIALYIDPTSGSGPVYVGLYSDNSGKPGTLLGQGTTSHPVAGSWNQIPITNSSITAGSKYWIALLGTTATSPYFRDRQTTICESQTTSATNLTSLPATWSTGATWQTCYISAYGLPATGSPKISLTPSTLSFSAIQGGASPASQNLSVTNTGTGTLCFTVSTDQSWLSATPAMGTAPQTIQVTAAVGSLAPGTYTGHVTVTAPGAQGSPAVTTVTFIVAPVVPPSIKAALSPAPDSYGWNDSSVTVTFTCTAGTYAIASCTSPVVVSTQGANQSVTGTAKDTSGLTATTTATVNLDATSPTITAVVTPAPVGGINYGSATVTFTCSDALSGIATCPAPVTDSTLGANQVITGTAIDEAGNTKSTSVTLDIQPISTTTVAASKTATFSSSNQNVTLTATVTSGSGTVNAGTVTFTVTQGSTTIGTAVSGTVASGAASAVYVLPGGTTSGTYTITAAYGGAGSFGASSDNAHTLTVASAATATAAANASASFSSNNQNVTLSATVTSGAGTVNAGTVTFTVTQGSSTIGTAVSGTVASGTASAAFVLPGGTATGSYTITAAYGGAGGFAASSDNTHILTVGSASTTTVAANKTASFSSSNQNVTLSAAVTSAAGTVNAGTVTFTVTQGSTTIGSAVSGTVASGAASAVYVLPGNTAAGSYTITAAYGGAGSFGASSDNAHTLTVASAATTTVAANASASFSGNNQNVTLSATVTSGAGTVSAGTVTFTVTQGATTIGSAVSGTVASGAASAIFSLPGNTAPGSYTITATYGATVNFAGSSDATHTLAVGSAATTTTAANASAAFSASSQNVTLSATVTSAAGTVNAGTVTFAVTQGATTIGSAVSGTVASGAASVIFSLPAGTAPGTYTITATYGGAGGFAGSSDGAHNLTIASAATTTLAANVSASFSASNQNVTLSALVSSAAGTVNIGTVTFTVSQGATVIGSAVTSGTVSGGAASVGYVLPGGTAAGSYTITATYNAAGGFAGSSDATHTLTVGSAATTTVAANATASFSTSSQNVTLSAAVTSGAGTVNAGTVTFTVSLSGTVIGSPVTSGTVTGGAASAVFVLPANALPGTYGIAAVYNAASGFAGSSDTAHTLAVASAASTTAAANASASFSASNQNVTLSATVTSAAGAVNAGTVTFTVSQGATVIGSTVTSGTVASGAASAVYLLPANTSAGSYTITAAYNAASGFAASSDNTHTLTVGSAATTTTGASKTATFSASNQNVTLTATISSAAGTVNAGTVTFTVALSGTVIGTPVTSGTVSSGAANAVYVLPGNAAPGTYTITAAYNAAGGFAASSDNTHTLTVGSAATTTTAANASASFSVNAQNVSLAATVTSVAGAVNAGTVTFTVSLSGTVIGSTVTSGTVTNGAASAVYVLPAAAVAGSYTIAAVYNAAGGFAGSSDSTHTLTLVGSATPPSISAAAVPAPNANGWNNSNVTVTFTCTAGSYPIKTCTSPVSVSTEGANQVISGTATDTSGKTATTSVTVSLDKTPPTITAAVTPAPVVGINFNSATVTFTCSDALSGIATCPSPITDSTIGAGQVISGTATDKAGNSNSTSVTLNIQVPVGPSITASAAPAANANGWNNTNVTVTFNCTAGSYPIQSCTQPVVVSTEGAGQTITGTATDTSGKTASASATVSIDKTPPTITATITPVPVGGINFGSATVSFVCSDALSGVAICPAPVTVTTVGAGQIISGTATDKAGNSSSASATLNVQPAVPPTIVAVVTPTPNSNGWDNAVVTVTFTCTAGSYPIKTCSVPVAINTESATQPVTGTATDTAGLTATASVTVSLDLTPPSITQFTAPSQLSPGQGGTATVAATDNFTLSSVAIQLNGVTLTTLTAPPYTASFAVPATAATGSTLTLTAIATDEAGNTASSSRGIQIVSAGVVVGQVLSDLTGLPFPGAMVQIVGGSGQDTSDVTGSYTIPSNAAQFLLSISAPANASTGAPAMITVQRFVSLQNGVGTVPVDARLTPVAAATSINASGGTLTGGSLSITVPAGAVASATNFHLTSLSQQGLPELLPLGWSPVAAFDLRSDSAVTASFNANFTQLPNTVTVHLVSYNYATDTWTMVMPNLAANNAALTIPIPSLGSYALVTPDAGNSSIVIPAAGQALAGVAMVSLPAGSTATGALVPPSVSPTGGTSIATLAIQSTVPLPSGTVIQANVLETYNLASGQQLSDPLRTEDLLLYQYNAPASAAAVATFPVTPSQTFLPGQLSSGDVHLDILSGRESVRGAVGGSDALVVTGGDATLAVSAGSLPQDTAIAVNPESTSSFLPTTAVIIPLAEYNVDFSGLTLNTPAQLSVAAGAANPGDNLFLAQIVRLAGAPYIVVVSQAQVTGTAMSTLAVAGLPGITQGGDYVFYKVTQPTGFAAGTVSSTSGPIASLVQTDGLPFVQFTATPGVYVVPALAGAVTVTASVPNTALAGTAAITVTAAQTTAANITVSGQVETATVTPANGSVGVPLTAEIDVTAPDAFNTATVTGTTVTLAQTGQGASTPIQVRFVFSQENTKLAVFPLAALQPSTTYTFAASGLANVLGGLTSVPTISFTTQAITPPNFNTAALVFAMPDQNGNVAISAPANSFPPGTTILIVDQTNGVVLSLTVANDGSVTGSMPATTSDLLLITITDPAGDKATFTQSQFVAPDGTVAIGPGGGTIVGPGGTGLIVPAGAVTKGVSFKLTQMDPTTLPDGPAVDNLNIGGWLRVQVTGTIQFAKEVKLIFPVPSGAPSGAQYYVYRRVTFADGSIGYEVIDEALMQGSGANAQIETASPPFPGFSLVLDALGVSDFILGWFVDLVNPGYFTQGAITGKVFGSQYQSGSMTPVTVGISGVTVRSQKPGVVDNATRKAVFATSQSDGTYTLWDPNFIGGTITVTADTSSISSAYLPPSPPSTYQTTAYEILSTDPNSGIILNTLLGRYRNIATGDITIPPPLQPAAPAAFNITLATVNGSGTRSVASSGIVAAGSSLVIGVKAALGSLQGVGVVGTTISVNGQGITVSSDPQLQYAVIANYLATDTGVFTIQVAVANAFGGPPATATSTFRVIGAGGSVDGVTPGQPPMVLTAGSYPTDQATQVPVDVSPSIAFTEPVLVPLGSVTLQDSNGNSIAMTIAGLASNGQVYGDITKAPASTAFTTLTLQPIQPLRYSSQPNDPMGTYVVSLSSSIVDQNQPPLALQSTTITFYTFRLQTLSTGGAAFSSPGIFVARNRAYVAKIEGQGFATVWQYDVTNPASPVAIQASSGGNIEGRPDYVSGQDNSPVVNGDTLIAVAQAPYPISAGSGFQASNVYLYKGTSAAVPPPSGQKEKDSLKWIGAVSLTQGASDGIVNAIAVNGTQLYAATDRKGIQVVDLNQVVTDFNNTLLSATVYYAINTEGQGFAQDAVIATIGVQGTSSLEYLDDLRDIKVANYSISGGPVQTYAVATGWVPSAPGSSTGASLIVVDPAGQAVVSKSEPQASTGLLTNGVSLAVGTIQTATVAQNIAVVVGQGSSPQCSNCSILAVIDMTDAANPVGLSFVGLRDIATSVVLRDNSAIVGYAGDESEIFDLTNPAGPNSIAVLQGVGGSLFVYNDDILFSTGSVPGVPGSSLGGVHSAVLGIIGVIPPIPPILSVDQNLSSPTGTRRTLVPATVNVAVYPSGIQALNPTLTFVGANAPTQSVALDPKSGMGSVQLPAQLQVPGQSFTATFSFTSSGKTYTSTQQINTGTVKLFVDQNNDTRVDQDDVSVKLANITAGPTSAKKFAFWQQDSSTSPLSPTDVLQDFATLRLYMGANATSGGTGRINLNMPGFSWQIGQKTTVASELEFQNDPSVSASERVQKKYLTDTDEAQAQLNAVNAASLCGFLQSAIVGLCTSGPDISGNPGTIELPNLAPANDGYEFLMRCQYCTQNDFQQINVEYVDPAGSGTRVILDTVYVDIRPINNWVDAWSARDNDSGTGDLPAGNPDTEYRPNGLVRVSGWGYLQHATDTQPVNPTSASVTVLVHGFSVSRSNALTSFIPQYTKRLYWTGSPVFPVQATDKGPAFTVGILWKGDHRKWQSVFGIDLGSTNGLFFPDDEYVAMRSGHSLALYLSNLQGQGDNINVVAHSLGNLFVNSAILEAPTGTVATYVMNEAAVTAEAFATSLSQVDPSVDFPITDGFASPLLQGHRQSFLAAHLTQMGYSTDPTQIDQVWIEQAMNVLSDEAAQQVFDQQYGVSTPGLETQGQINDYEYRWSSRPADTVSISSSPWLGYFSGNLAKTNLYNSFSYGDCALIQAFALNQLIQKPDRATVDSFAALDYAYLTPTLIPGANPFPASNRIDTYMNQLWIKQSKPTTTLDTISRLAYWYPARAGAAGSFDFQSVFQNNTINFTDISTSLDTPPCSIIGPPYLPLDVPAVGGSGQGIVGLSPTGPGVVSLGLLLSGHLRTHGYMTGSQTPTIWPAYKKLQQTFYPSSSYPTFKDPDQ